MQFLPFNIYSSKPELDKDFYSNPPEHFSWEDHSKIANPDEKEE